MHRDREVKLENNSRETRLSQVTVLIHACLGILTLTQFYSDLLSQKLFSHKIVRSDCSIYSSSSKFSSRFPESFVHICGHFKKVAP